MALTNDDILKLDNTIKSSIRKEVGIEIKNLKNTLTGEIKLSRMKIQSSIGELENRIKNIVSTQNDDSKTLTILRQNVKKLQKDLISTINFFDNRDITQKMNLEKTRSELGLDKFNYN